MPERVSLPNKVAKFMFQKRQAMGLTQEEMAIRVFGDKKHRPWLCKIENGRGITLETLDKILIAINADMDIIEF